MHHYDCRPCGFRADAIGDEESIAVRSCPRCGRRNAAAVFRFFGITALWSFAALFTATLMASQSEWRTDVTLFVMGVSLVVVGIVSLARTAKWRSVRARVTFVQPEPRRSTPKGNAALTSPS